MYFVCAMLCEQILEEQDQVLSAIRIGRPLQYSRWSGGARGTKPGVEIHVPIQLRGQIGDTDEHVIELILERPNGEIQVIDKRSAALRPLH